MVSKTFYTFGIVVLLRISLVFNVAGVEAYNNQTDKIIRLNETCTLKLDNRSKDYFQTRIAVEKPNIVYFRIYFADIKPNYSKEALYPTKWIWTYAKSKDVYPYVHWAIDYDIFSFNLLDAETTKVEYMKLYASDTCRLTLGTANTTLLIANTLGETVHQFDHSGFNFNQYAMSYWCYIAEVPGIRQTIEYFLGLYLDYPVIVIKYNCCTTKYYFHKSKYTTRCPDKQMDIWPQCTVIPFILGILLFLYSPVVLLDIGAYLSKNENIKYDENTFKPSAASLLINEGDEHVANINGGGDTDENDWVYLDGSVPISFADLLRNLFNSKHQVLYSRIRRLIFLLISPILVYIRIIVYDRVQFKTINDMMKRGVPFGFVALVAKTTEGRSISFVPALGGPITVVLTFYICSILFFVLPSSLKLIVKMGIPSTSRTNAPLCFSASQIKQIAQIPVKDDPGYKNAANHMRCSFFMLFRCAFWRELYYSQKTRFDKCIQTKQGLCQKICLCLLPLYVVLCATEILIAVVYYSLPLLGLVVIIIRGATAYIGDKMRRGGNVTVFLLNCRCFVAMSTVVVVVIVTFYVYCVYLVFIESFIFLSEFFVYSYLAVIIYPAVAFGYLFFTVVLGYYIFRLIHGFGYRYLDLLNDVIEISLNIDQHDNHVAHFDGNLIISNVKIREVKSIQINGVVFPVARNMGQNINNTHGHRRQHVRYKDDAYGIRKDLFDYVICKHMPIHQQVLRVIFHLSLIVLMILFTISITKSSFTGPESQIAEVMHVVFIVTIGALPRVLEVAMTDSSEHIERDLKMRKLERTIYQYWAENREDDI